MNKHHVTFKGTLYQNTRFVENDTNSQTMTELYDISYNRYKIMFY